LPESLSFATRCPIDWSAAGFGIALRAEHRPISNEDGFKRTPIGYPMVNVRDIESGKVRAIGAYWRAFGHATWEV